MRKHLLLGLLYVLGCNVPPPGARGPTLAESKAFTYALQAWNGSGLSSCLGGCQASAEEHQVVYLPESDFEAWCGYCGPTAWFPEPCHSPWGRAYSCHYRDTDTIIIHAGALTAEPHWVPNILQHEVLHHISGEMLGNEDYYHTNNMVWGTVLYEAGEMYGLDNTP